MGKFFILLLGFCEIFVSNFLIVDLIENVGTFSHTDFEPRRALVELYSTGIKKSKINK